LSAKSQVPPGRNARAYSSSFRIVWFADESLSQTENDSYLISGAMLPRCAMYFVAEEFSTECTKYPGRFKNAVLAANVKSGARRETKLTKKVPKLNFSWRIISPKIYDR